MNDTSSRNILASRFRANPDYELVIVDRLPMEQHEAIKELLKDPNFYGILRPLGESRSGVKSVSRDVALLYLTLQRPGTLPEYVQRMLGERCDEHIKKLVLDRVLELDCAGKFLSGPEAAGFICPDDPRSSSGSTTAGFLERLSLEALRYGQSLGIDDPLALSGRLYAYNRTPLTPDWKRLLCSSQEVAEYLCIHGAGRNRQLLDAAWIALSNGHAQEGWFGWQPRTLAATATVSSRKEHEVACKLYISPITSALREVFPSILAVLSASRVKHFKLGNHAGGLLRPDKMVAYFASCEDLYEASEHLQAELGGCPAQGVPFTAELSRDGLLSMGVDPPVDGQVLPWIGPESWRLWVTNRLAVSLVAAGAAGTVDPCQFALGRLRLEGIDTHRWIPSVIQLKSRDMER